MQQINLIGVSPINSASCEHSDCCLILLSRLVA
jgi:hypothetical protein